MASDPRAQHYLECTKCDRNAEHYCNTCSDNLCVHCKKEHESKHHDVVLYREKTVELCSFHSEIPYTMCCQQCGIPVCYVCISEHHKNHSFVNIGTVFESKREKYQNHISKIRNVLLPESQSLLKDVRSDRSLVLKETARIQSVITSRAKKLKDIIDDTLAQNLISLQKMRISKISELQEQEETMTNYIVCLHKIIDEYETCMSTKQQCKFLLLCNDNPDPTISIPDITDILLPSFNKSSYIASDVERKDIAKVFGEVKASTKSVVSRKVRRTQEAVQKRNTFVQLLDTTKIMSFSVSGISYSHHISPITATEVCVSDYNGNLAMNDEKISYANNRFGCHSMTNTGDLIFLDREENCINKITPDKKKKPKLITKVPNGMIQSMHSSYSNGDILVGIEDKGEAQVIRFKKTGQEVQRIQYDNRGQPLYACPRYITENHINSDVCVSDGDKQAVVVVDKDGTYRFSYKGPPPELVLMPYGISTDKEGHILVSDLKTYTVQVIDKDGIFLTFLLTKEQGINAPAGLYVDYRNTEGLCPRLWVGECFNNSVSVYKYVLGRSHFKFPFNKC